MWKLKPIWKEKIVFSWKNFEIIQQEYKTENNIKLFEIAKRAPWVRLFILDKINNKILLTKEYRTELKSFDYRLPWWKVFDTPEERKKADYSKIEEYAKKAWIKECLEETGLIAKNIKLFWISKAGATIDWTLYYYIIDDFEISKTWQELETWEVITVAWYSFDDLILLSKNWKIKEDRSLWMIFKFLLKNWSIKI